MHTGEPQGGEKREDRRDQRDVQRIGIGGGDDQIARIQLAARWSEAFAPEHGDTLASMLRRFRTAFDYLDSVTHNVEPVELAPDQPNSTAPGPPPQSAVESSVPTGEPQAEPRPW